MHRLGRVRQNRSVTFWKPHALAKPHENQLQLRTGDRVVSTIELHEVPEGTLGKVILANGFNWQRYRVLFSNGVEHGDLDRRHIAATGKTAKRLDKAAKRP
jgi:hypothetical protein